MSYSQEPMQAGELTVTERTLYVVGGLILAAAGAKPRGNLLMNVLALSAGSYLAWRGAEGSCPVKAAISEQTSQTRQLGA